MENRTPSSFTPTTSRKRRLVLLLIVLLIIALPVLVLEVGLIIRSQATDRTPAPTLVSQATLPAGLITPAGTSAATPTLASLPATHTPIASATIPPAASATASTPATATPIPTLPPPTPTPPPSATATLPPPTPTPAGGWRGEYYSNLAFSGSPTLVRDDLEIDFNWGTGAPAAGLPVDNFTVRWTRDLTLPAGGYRFFARSDDGVRLWIDGVMAINEWHNATDTTYVAARTLTAGTHSLRVEYYEALGNAYVQLWWEQVGQYPDWRGDYFSNPILSGSPDLTRSDSSIQFNWGRGSPATHIPNDNFSARWTRTLNFEAGLYHFYTIVDDGMRLYIDDQLIINEWHDGRRRQATADRQLTAGYHRLQVEYYERLEDATIQFWWAREGPFPDWRGEYWSNTTFNGPSLLVRNDPAIDFDWGSQPPFSGMPSDNFAVRWTRTTNFGMGTYRFHLRLDDGARLWVDDVLLIDEWRNGADRTLTADLALTAGSHTLRLDYYENLGDALVSLWWEQLENPAYPDWQGSYWSNRELSGAPALIRNDAAINFNWGSGAPAYGLPSDDFSAQWTRQITFPAGTYRLNAQANDGVRVYVDGSPVIDEWHDSTGSQVYTAQLPLSGEHNVRVTYYEGSGTALVRFWYERTGDLATPTPTNTVAPTPTSEPENTPTPTASPPGEKSTPTPSATPSATPPATPSATPPATPTATGTPTPTATLMPAPTDTPTPTITPPPPVWLNELLSRPGTVDWNGDGQVTAADTWIELYNSSEKPVNLAGWQLIASAGSGPVQMYQFPAGIQLQAGELLLLFQQETNLNLYPGGGQLQLLTPGNQPSDAVLYARLPADASSSRDMQGIWHSDWPPSPGRVNSPNQLSSPPPGQPNKPQPR